MSDDNSNVETDNLGDFEDLFYERKPEEVKEVEAEVVDDEVEAEEAEIEDTNEEDAVEETEDEDEAEAKPEKRNRKSAKERIEELTAARYEAERRALDAERRALDAEKLNAPKEEQEAKHKPDISPAPNPDAKDDKGEAKYPLGEFDPQYIRDLTRFTIEQEQAGYAQKEATRRQEEASNAARAQAQEKWVGRLDEAEKDIPDVKEKIISLSTLFADVEPQYGQYLVDVVQTLENGPHVLAYLADNPKEAQTIVKSGPTGATISLGRLDARLAKIASNDKAPVKVTNAPPAPKQTPRGTGKSAIRADTDDLTAFERQFFKKR